MKRLTIGLLLLLLFAGCAKAFAVEPDDTAAIQMAQNQLTEVYGYTREETMLFTYQVTYSADTVFVHFFQRSDWTYRITIRREDWSIRDSHTPFTTQYADKASENSVRQTLHAIKDNDWFAMWNVESKAMLRELIDGYGDIRVNEALQTGLSAEDYTPAQALEDLFISCYGEEWQWAVEVSAWRDAAFETFGLKRAGISFSRPEGITTRKGLLWDGRDETMITEFAGQTPDALAEAFADPNLQGWACLAGAYQEGNPFRMGESFTGTGLAAFANGEERLLVMLLRDTATQRWRVQPISKSALLAGRALYITFESQPGSYTIHYPLSDTEEESFQCRLIQIKATDSKERIACRLLEYRHTDRDANTTLMIDGGGSLVYSGWYQVTLLQNGAEEKAQYIALTPDFLEYINAEAFPKTAAACQAASEVSGAIPQGYGLSSYVHLRQKASSHSTDLGMYRRGTLVQVLDTLPGSSFPWYHVRIGTAEGYMSGNYVEYYDNLQSVPASTVANLAKTKADTALKQSANAFAQTVRNLPAGTIVRVLAEYGNWLHISIPASDGDWLMQPDETSGYVKAGAVVEGLTALQLEWLLPVP